MTTDTKAVAWTVVDGSGESSIGGWSDMRNFEQSKNIASVREGHRYAFAISMDDHKRVVGELTKAHEQNLSSWLDQRQEIETLRTALAASRAEVEGLKKDAERWRHARRILPVLYIEDSQEKHVMWARSADEAENLKADKAIDAAMENGNV